MNPVSVKLSIQQISQQITLGFNETIQGGGFLPWYDGDYVATPKTESQTLLTRNKSMRNNVTVEAVPYSEVSNPEGGVTVNIAFE